VRSGGHYFSTDLQTGKSLALSLADDRRPDGPRLLACSAKNVTPLVPALRSYWLWLHVSVTLLGEAFLAVAFVASILYLTAGRDSAGKLESQKDRKIRPHCLPGSSRWFPAVYTRGFSFWHDLGQPGLGALLELGSKRSLVLDYLAFLCPLSSYQTGHGLERKKISSNCHYWFSGCSFYFFRGQLPAVRTP